MRRFRPRISGYQLRGPASDEIARDADVEGEPSSPTYERKPKKLSAVRTTLLIGQLEFEEWDHIQLERLDELSSFRIRPAAIKITSSVPSYTGGKAEVVKATLQHNFWKDKQQVAVKKLKCHQGMDKHKFANVRGRERGQDPNASPGALTFQHLGICS